MKHHKLFTCHACSSPLERGPRRSFLFQWLYTHVTPECVIHPTRMDSRDLGYSHTDNLCVVWDPPLVAQLCCSGPDVQPLHTD